MKSENLYESIGEIDEELLARSEEKPAARRILPFRIAAAAAACVCAAAALTALPFLKGRDLASGVNNDNIANGTVDVSELPPVGDEMVRIPTWEESGTVRRFPEVEHTGLRYSGRSAVLPAQRIGEGLGSVELTGYDVYEGRLHTANAEIFRIEGIAEDCAVALRFAGEEVCYPYVNSSCAPETLGQMIEDLDLAHTLSFGQVYSGQDGRTVYTWRTQPGDGNSEGCTGLPAEAAWSLLLANRSAEAVEYKSSAVYSISVSLPLLGYENVSMAVTEDGFLTTNLLDSGKAFRIGTDAVKAFAAYMDAHFEAVKLPMANGGEEIPE